MNKDIISNLKKGYIEACEAAGIRPIDNFEYNIATGCGDSYISQLEATNNGACRYLADKISSLISRI